MKISIWAIGKNHEPYVRPGVVEFTARIEKYFKVEWNIIPVPKNAGMLSEMDLRKKEAETVFEWLRDTDYLVALDEHGKQFTSPGFAKFIQARGNASIRNLVFLIGGAYGLDPSLLKKANHVMGLSALTFPHQLVRLVLAEQIYRACTILRNEKYHH
jgi:23S rRNA (pseudouridine1915-N3)-methyltransferase